MLDLFDVTALFGFCAVLAYFWRAQGTREIALRYKGCVITLGNRIESFELEPHRFPDDILH